MVTARFIGQNIKWKQRREFNKNAVLFRYLYIVRPVYHTESRGRIRLPHTKPSVIRVDWGDMSRQNSHV